MVQQRKGRWLSAHRAPHGPMGAQQGRGEKKSAPEGHESSLQQQALGGGKEVWMSVRGEARWFQNKENHAMQKGRVEVTQWERGKGGKREKETR